MLVGQNILMTNVKNDCYFDYYGKCPHCGYVEKSGTIGFYCGRGSQKGLGKRRCTKCHTQYDMAVDNRR